MSQRPTLDDPKVGHITRQLLYCSEEQVAEICGYGLHIIAEHKKGSLKLPLPMKKKSRRN